jgi:plastocyanin
MVTRWMRMAVYLLILLGALTACAGPAETTIYVDMTDYFYDPAVWRIAAGQEIMLQVTNTGTISHEWAIMKTPASIPWNDSDFPEVYWDTVVPAGKTETLKFIAPTEGEYEIVCGLPGHIEEGMVGWLVAYNPAKN